MKIRGSFAYDLLAAMGLTFITWLLMGRYVELWIINHP